jgi:hypothetical protein
MIMSRLEYMNIISKPAMDCGCRFGRSAEMLPKIGLTVPNDILEPIRKIPLTTDEGWKCNCIDYMVWGLPLEQRQRLRPKLERIAHTLTQEEIGHGARDTAQESESFFSFCQPVALLA